MKDLLKDHRLYLSLILLSFGTYFILLFSHLFVYTPEGIFVNHVHVWGDWSLHIAMANIFAYKDPIDWFAYHPYFAGGKFTYGFLTNMISGLLFRFGVPFGLAFSIPSTIYSLFLLVGMYLTLFTITQNKKASFLAVTLFFLSSGPGFIPHVFTFFENPSFAAFFYPEYDISRIEKYQWLAGNFVNGMLLPQRAFLLGMTISVWILFLFLSTIREFNSKSLSRVQRKKLVVAGILAGILPITHMHSLIFLVIVTGLISALHYKNWKKLAWYVIPAAITTSLFFFGFVYGGIKNPEFMGIDLGWSADKGVLEWLMMWLMIWGFAIPFAVISIALINRKDKIAVGFYLGILIVFILGNIVRFQPVMWDNSKLFLWVYFGISALNGVLIAELTKNRGAWLVLASIVWLSLTTTGVVELTRLQNWEQQRVFFANYTEIELGKKIRELTPPRAVFATSPEHNHPVMLWGVRSVLMGYPTWVWNFGFLHNQRQIDIQTLYKGGSEAEAIIDKYDVDYVVIGPVEKGKYNPNSKYFNNTYSAIIRENNYTIYDTDQPL